MIKNITAVLIGLSMMPLVALAQSGNAADSADASVQTQNPAEVYVRNLALSTTHGQAGEILRGTFLLANARTEPVSNIYYHVLLMKRASSGEMLVFDDKSFGPENLPGGQSKTVSLDYVIPGGVSGSVVVRVRAVLAGGFKMGWKDAPFVVDGSAASMNSLEVTQASVVINGKTFAPSEGPTVYPEDKAFYNVTVKNDGTRSLTVIPRISLYEKDVTGTPVISTTSDAATIAPGDTKDIVIGLPRTDAANSYEAKVELQNQKNENVAPLLSFRYLIGGDILTIQSVVSNKKAVSAGDTVTLSIAYTGTPADLTGREVHAVGTADVTAYLKNENGDILASTTSPLNFNAAEGVLPLSITTTAGAKALSVSLIIVKGDRTLARFDAALSSIPVSNGMTDLSLKKIVMVIPILFLLAVLFGAGMLWKKFQKPAVTMLALVVAGALFGHAPKAEAFTVTDSYNVSRTIFTGQDWRPTVFVNDPYGTVAPGEQFYINMDVEILACHNKPSYITYFAKDWNASGYVNMGQVNRGADNKVEHFSYSYTDTVTCGAGASGKCVSSASATSPGVMFTAPSVPGTYRIYFRILNDPHISTIVVDPNDPATFSHAPIVPDDGSVPGGHELNYGWIEGYQEFTVTPPAAQLANADIHVERTIVGGTATGTQARLGPYMREGVHYAFTSPATSTIMTDLTGNGGDAIASTTVTTNSSDVPGVLAGQKSAFIQSGNFSLSNGVIYNSEPITLPDQVLRGARTGSISVWVKWNGKQQCASNICGTVLARQGPPPYGYMSIYNSIIGLDGENPSTAHLLWHPYTGAAVNVISSAVVGNGWHHVAVTFDPRNHYVYLDGTLVASYTFSSDQQMDTAVGLTNMGQLYGSGGAPYYGHVFSDINVADIRIYPRPLSSSEVSTLTSGGSVAYPQQWVSANAAKFSYLPVDPAGKTYSVNVSPDFTTDYDLTVGWCLFNKSSETNCTPATFAPRSNYTTEACDTVSCSVPVTVYPAWGCTSADQTSTSIICGKEGYVTKVVYKYVKRAEPVTGRLYCGIVVENGRGWNVDYFSYPSSYEYTWPQPWWDRGCGGPLVNGYAPPGPAPRDAVFDRWFNKLSTSPLFTSVYSTTETNLVHGSNFFPIPGVNPDYSFGAHWSGRISTTTAGTYRYHFSLTDDRVWMYVDGVLQQFDGEAPYLGSPYTKGSVMHTGTITLQAGVPRTVDIYYAQSNSIAGGGAGCTSGNSDFNFIFDVDNASIPSSQLSSPTQAQIDNPVMTACRLVTNRGLLVRKVGPNGSELEAPIRDASNVYVGGDIKIDNVQSGMTGSTVLKWAPGLTAGTHTIAAQQLGVYQPYIGACKYLATSPDITPSSECFLADSDLKPMTCTGGWCTPQSGTGDPAKDFRIKKVNGTYEAYPSATFAEDGMVTKVVIKYAPSPIVVTSCAGSPNYNPTNPSQLTTTWSVSQPTGGTGSYTYQWNELVPSGNAEGLQGVTWSVGAATGTTQSIVSKYIYDPSQFGVNTANNTQFKSVQLTVSSGSATPKVLNCGYVYLNPPTPPPVNISCSPSKTSILRGQSVTWSVSGGTGSSAYQWNFSGSPESQSPMGCTSGYSTSCGSVTTQYLTSGIKAASVSLQGASGPAVMCSTNVSVSNLPIYKQF